jgi:hypothetical protein
MIWDAFRKISAAPTNPKPAARPQRFDVADLYSGPLATAAPDAASVDLA